jgi:hypothetical protein
MTVFKADDFYDEVEALRILTGCKATPVASGGIDGMEGGYVFVLEEARSSFDAAWELLAGDQGQQAAAPARF